MKATIDVPDALYRQVEGRAVREVTIELYRQWLGEPEGSGSSAPTPLSPAEWLARWEELGAETLRKAIDPRPTSEIITSERR